LVARTVALSDTPDLLAEAGELGLLWADERGGLAGSGVAVRLDIPGGLSDPESVKRVAAALQSIETVDEVGLPGCGPVAIGALPFDPTSSGYLTIPRRVVGRAGRQGWLTTIEEATTLETTTEPSPTPAGRVALDDLRSGPGPGSGSAGSPPDQFTLTSTMSHRDWKETVAEAVATLKQGDLLKVVLARRIEITANRAFVVSDVLERLAALYPSCMIFSVAGFIGASPELLLSRTGDRVESHPLAGTVARSGDVHGDEALVAKLLSSPKARHEHQVVVDVLCGALEPLCGELTVPDGPSVVGLRNVSHLGTHITGRLKPAGPGGHPSALELAARIHPTPAVGGTPTDAAIRYLQKVEGFDRGCYGGPVGWVDRRGDGAWAVGIRCADVDGPTARLYAGNGIVEGSDPAEELAETQLKLQALLAALVRP
jgi:menaquinone-specific isochorismate synthase